MNKSNPFGKACLAIDTGHGATANLTRRYTTRSYTASMRRGRIHEPSEIIEQRFRRLVAQWQEAMKYSSSLHDRVEHPAYRAIIQMGQPVVRLLIEELRLRPDYWFDALTAITGDDPIPTEDYGRLGRMAAAWIRWAKSKGIE
jgi:hypothetical protein